MTPLEIIGAVAILYHGGRFAWAQHRWAVRTTERSDARDLRSHSRRSAAMRRAVGGSVGPSRTAPEPVRSAPATPPA